MATFTLAGLQSERTNDPAALGYAGKTDAQVAALINTATATSVFRNDIKTAEIVGTIVAADFVSLSAVQIAKLQLMLTNGVFDATVSNTRTIFLGIFTGMTNTITALTALAQRPGTRAEVLWGTGTIVTERQCGQARNGT